MSFKCGIVGLPNVGKSTLFNALTNSSKAQAANFPFCTIDPNVGVVPVPDYRLENLSKINYSYYLSRVILPHLYPLLSTPLIHYLMLYQIYLYLFFYYYNVLILLHKQSLFLHI